MKKRTAIILCVICIIVLLGSITALFVCLSYEHANKSEPSTINVSKTEETTESPYDHMIEYGVDSYSSEDNSTQERSTEEWTGEYDPPLEDEDAMSGMDDYNKQRIQNGDYLSPMDGE